jgi:peptidoglycan/LPS O-acetylase OafA/YrhL
MVVMHHVVRTDGFPSNPGLRHAADLGNVGVQVFFVLSGFLITWLLLGEERRSGRVQLGAFYGRRALRILPPAFAYLGVLAVVASVRGLPVVPEELRDSALFVRNLGAPHSLYTRHFWSLAIEEQFYLLWPLLLVMLPARARLPLVAGLVLFEPVWRQLNMWHFTAAQVNWTRTDLRYSGLLVGALLALAWHDPVWRARLQRLTRRGALTFGLSAAAFVLLTASPPGSRPVLLRTDAELFLSLPVALMLLVVAEGRAGVFSTALEWAPLRWLGRISYSLYLWQQLFCMESTGPWYERFPQNIGVALACAVASYWLIEQPVLRLRERLGPAGAAAPAAPAR